MKIKAWVLGAAALATASIAGQVQAADFGAGAPPYAVVNNWAGFYFGANLGFTHTNADVTVSVPGFALTGSGSDTQFTGGLLAGYNWQSGDRVWGIEADISGLSDWDYIGSIRARYGLIYGNWLYYGTIGVGFIDSGGSISAPGFSYNGYSNAGLAVGGGAETKINSRLAAGVEGIFYWFPDDTQNVLGTSIKTNVDVISIRARLTYQLDGSRDFLK
jgi:opacity protein-like surface antigen